MLTQTIMTDEDLKLLDMFMNNNDVLLQDISIKYICHDMQSLTYEYKGERRFINFYESPHIMNKCMLLECWGDDLKADIKKCLLKHL